jgi:hypothetical protein
MAGDRWSRQVRRRGAVAVGELVPLIGPLLAASIHRTTTTSTTLLAALGLD